MTLSDTSESQIPPHCLAAHDTTEHEMSEHDREKIAEPLEPLPKETNIETTIEDFDGPDDPANPKSWSSRYKWTMIAILSAIEMTTNLAVTVCVPAMPYILADFHATDDGQDLIIVVTIWNLGALMGMLTIGPLSEVYGRRPLYNIANILFFLLSIGSALSISLPMLLAFRFLNGIMLGSQALNSSIVGDMFPQEKRGRPQSLIMIGPLLGPVIGPVAGGYLSQALDWRWAFWFPTIVIGVLELMLFSLQRESYKPLILRRKYATAQGDSTRSSLNCKFHLNPSTLRKTREVLFRALTRPFRICIMPIFILPASCVCLMYAYYYTLLTTLASVFEMQYHFSPGQAGLTYLGLALGMAASTCVCSTTLDWHTQRMKRRHGTREIKPEWRLPLISVGGLTAATGLFLYGWTAEARVQFVVPIIGTAFLTFSTSSTVISILTYFSDVFGNYRASAVSALIVSRQVVTIVFPLAAPPLYARLGLGWGNSLLGFIALLAIPIPLFLLRYGEKLRRASKIEKLGS